MFFNGSFGKKGRSSGKNALQKFLKHSARFFEKKIKKQLDYRASEHHREEIAGIKSFILI